MPIEQSEDGRAWFLTTPATMYAVGLNGEGVPSQLYWGQALPRSDWPLLLAGTRPGWNTDSNWPTEVEGEILAEGGMRWGVSGLSVSFPGKHRSLELEFRAATIDGDSLALTLKDRLFPLAVTLNYRIRPGTDVLERWAEIAYGADAQGEATLHRADSANWFIEDQENYRYSSVSGYWGSENQVERGMLPHGELVFTSRTGTTSHSAQPWIMIDDGLATEEFGIVRTVALAWSGTWRMTTQQRPEGGVSITTGAGHDGAERILKPGATITTPSSFGLLSDGGFGGASRAWHAFARDHVLPRSDELRPVLYNSWEATLFDVTETGQIALADLAARIGCELFVVDDGWFGARTNDAAGLGDWTPNPERFPNGLHDLVAHVNGLGMKFGIWVEPEMVNPDSDLYRAHPDWVLHYPGRKRGERRNQLVLNFAREDVQQWALGWLDDLVGTYGVDFLKWDMNRPFSQAGWPDNENDQGSLWFGHVEALYDILAKLRERHPGLRIESCSSGGGRVDLGIARYVDQFWTSDNTDARDRQSIQHGFSQLYPPIAMTNWVTDSPNPNSGREIPLDYRFHVAMAGTLGVGGNLAEWSEDELERAAAHIVTYKNVRQVIQLGDLHRIGGEPGVDFSAVEYLLGDRVIILSFEPSRSLYRGPRRFRLVGLDETATYLEEGTGATYSGAFLMQIGLEILPEDNSVPSNGYVRFSRPDYSSALGSLRRLS